MEPTTTATSGDAAGETTDRRPSRGRRTALAVAAAVGVAAVVRVLALLLVGDAPGVRLLAPRPLFGAALAAALAAAGVYGVVRWLSSTPDRTFRRLIVVGAVGSLVAGLTVGPTLRGATPVGLALVALARVAVTATLTGWRREPESDAGDGDDAATRWRR